MYNQIKMESFKNIFKGINWPQFILLSILTALIGVPVVAFISKLAKDNGELFFRDYEINLSLAKTAVFLVLVFLVYLVANNILVKRRKLSIVKAEYGVPGSFVDITPEIQDFVSNNALNVIISNGLTGGFDPKPNVHKRAVIRYKLGSKEDKLTVSEGDRASLPRPK